MRDRGRTRPAHPADRQPHQQKPRTGQVTRLRRAHGRPRECVPRKAEVMSPESHDEHGNEDDRRPSGTRGSDTDCWLEKATVSQNRLVAHFKPDGTYAPRAHVSDGGLASISIHPAPASTT